MESGSKTPFLLWPRNRFAWLLVVLVAGSLATAIHFLVQKASTGVPVGLLPRDGDLLHPDVFAVGDWVAGANGFVGLKYHVQGPALDPEQWLRFTEGAGRSSARAIAHWTDALELPVGEPFEFPFKDDC